MDPALLHQPHCQLALSHLTLLWLRPLLLLWA
jgi:hypothetical protein